MLNPLMVTASRWVQVSQLIQFLLLATTNLQLTRDWLPLNTLMVFASRRVQVSQLIQFLLLATTNLLLAREWLMLNALMVTASGRAPASVKDFGSRVSAPHVKDYFEQAAKDGILEAQYNYGMGLLSESTDIQDLRHGVEVLSWAAKEILLRRQCKSVQINCGHQLLTFLYSPLPNLLTKRATDNYIWDHLAENLAKLGRMSCSEIFHPVIPTMVPQAIPSLSQIEN